MYRAHHRFKPDRDNEHTDIELRIGDIVTNVEYLDNGWSIGYNVSTQNAGIFPRRNIRVVQEDNSSIFPPSIPKNRPVFSEERVEEYVNSDEIVNWWRIVDREALRQAYYQVVHTQRHQFKILKGCVGFVAGILLGALAFIGLHYALDYPPIVAGIIAGIIGLILIIGLSFSTKCRTVVWLCIPTLATKSGRLMLSTIAISLLLAGPVTNITNNASDLAGVSSCAGELLVRELDHIKMFAKKPYEQLVAGLKRTVAEVQKTLNIIRSLVKPIQNALGEIVEIRNNIQTELAKAASECKAKLDDSNRDCKLALRRASADCNGFINDAAVSFSCGAGGTSDRFSCPGKVTATDECNKLLDETLCSPVASVSSVCDGLDDIALITDFGDVFQKMSDALNTSINIRETIEGGVTSNQSTKEIVKSIKAELQQRTRVITQTFVIVNWILSLTILLVVVQAYLYLRNYMVNDKHDNSYITDAFVLVDQKRNKKGKWSLLPLTPKESKLVTDKRQYRMSGIEKKAFCTGFLPILFNILGGAAVVAFDFLLYEAILLSNKHGGVKIDYNENIDLGIEVPDGGLIATFLQQLIGNMRIKSSIDNHTIDFSECLAQGNKPQYLHLIGLGIIYGAMLVLMMIHAYSLRLRHRLAGYFYPEREKDRIKFLHRKLLRRRVITIKELKDVLMVKRQNQENNTVAKDFIDDLKSSCGCYRSYNDECFICERVEQTDQLHWCDQCNSYFCSDCFNITINKVCPCNPEVSLTYDHVTDSDFEDDVQDQIVDQYYAYADRGMPPGQQTDEEIAMPVFEHPDNGHTRHNGNQFFRQHSLL